jgi:spoIIIJ-associated protein
MTKNSEQHQRAIEIEGKTVQDAIENGLKQLGLNKEDVEIKILNEGTPGLFGLMGSKAAKISIMPKPGRAGAGFSQSPESIRGAEPAPARPFTAPQKVSEEINKLLYKHVSEIVKLMNISEKQPSIKTEQTNEGFTVEIDFQDPVDGSLLIGKGGKTLSSFGTVIQSMINHAFREKVEDSPLPRISIDVNNYRIKQEEKVKDNLARILDTVRRTGKPYSMNPMPARMRRLVHIALRDNPEFESYSEGDGDNRNVIIKPRESSIESRSR